MPPKDLEGEFAPDFRLRDQHERVCELRDYRGQWVVLYAYPCDDTPDCTHESKAFDAILSLFRDLDATIIGISPDDITSHCKFAEKHGLNLRLVADTQYEVLKRLGCWGPEGEYPNAIGDGVIRSTYLISPSGIITHVWSPVDVDGHVESVHDELRRVWNDFGIQVRP